MKTQLVHFQGYIKKNHMKIFREKNFHQRANISCPLNKLIMFYRSRPKSDISKCYLESI